jgi:hypothetical protein
MTLRADLTALMADAGITDMDVDEAVEDEHVRLSLYLRVIAEATATQDRANDREVIGRILRDPEELTSKTAFVEFVDNVAGRSTDPAEFERWAAAITPEIESLQAEGNRRFLHDRIRDWTIYLTIKAGHTPNSAELAETTDWMQRTIAETSTSLPTLTLLAENGRTRKIRNVARNRAESNTVQTKH